MAFPEANWSDWASSTIEPFMKAVIHFPTGDVEVTDDDISNVSLSLAAFDSSATLFGTPTPSTGSLDIIDYDQRFNPTNNSMLQAGIQVDLFLGLKGIFSEEQLGPNLVGAIEDPVQVVYNRDVTWAYPFRTNQQLAKNTQYVLMFDYTLEDGSAASEFKIGNIQELFVRPSNWHDWDHYAVVYPQQMEISNLRISTVNSTLTYKYGTFYVQEWSYDSVGFTASVDLVDGINDILTLDNRSDGPLPSTATTNLLDFFIEYLELSTPDVVTTFTSGTVPYTFYEASQASTINKLVEAVGGILFALPDGTIVVTNPAGAYDTGVTLTDDDIETYSIEQTSAITMDSAQVNAMLPTVVESSEIVKYTEAAVNTTDDTFPLNAARVISVDYLNFNMASSDANQYFYMFPYTWDPVNLYFTGTMAVHKSAEVIVLGKVISNTPVPVYNSLGALPYTIADNDYIMSKEQAQVLVNKLDAFIDMRYRVIKITLRGAPLFWIGGKLRISSAMYDIDADYMIIGIQFTYNGAIATTMTLQRVVE